MLHMDKREDLDLEIMQLVTRIKHLSEESENDIAYTKLQKIRDLAEALIPRLEERGKKSA